MSIFKHKESGMHNRQVEKQFELKTDASRRGSDRWSLIQSNHTAAFDLVGDRADDLVDSVEEPQPVRTSSQKKAANTATIAVTERVASTTTITEKPETDPQRATPI